MLCTPLFSLRRHHHYRRREHGTARRGLRRRMAGGSDGTDVPAGGEIWGTLEELLLAFAVCRHGTASWDSVATEVQAR
uniref:Myb-like domain-containing protein n=1 Tax=Aegilops tauschii subsp. strangulata TaxID=200361 RepID=A0A453L499_AEGTS